VHEFLNSALDGDVCSLPCCSHLTSSYVVWVQQGRHKITTFSRNWILVILHVGSQDSKRYPSCFSNRPHLIYFEVLSHISLMLQQQFCVECVVISNRYNVRRKCMWVRRFQKSKIDWNNSNNRESVGMSVCLIVNWMYRICAQSSLFLPLLIILTHWGRGHLNCLNALSRGF